MTDYSQQTYHEGPQTFGVKVKCDPSTDRVAVFTFEAEVAAHYM